MRIEHEEGDFYAVYNATPSMREYFRYTVPTTHRRYESEPRSRWVVHRKYLDIKDLLLKEDPYTVLCLTKDAPRFMIETAWKAHALHCHPDRGGSTDAFQRVKTAYEALKHDRDNDGGPSKKKGTNNRS